MNDYLFSQRFVLRFPYYPVSVFVSSAENDDVFKQTISSNEFKKAIYFASSVLYEELKKLEFGELKEKEKEKVKCSLFKYLARMSTRCTPFASFAAVAMGEMSDITNLKISSDRIKSHIRLDMSPMIMLCGILQDRNVERLSYRLNPTLIEYKNIVRYIYRSLGISDSFFKIHEIKKTSILSWILRHTRCGYITWMRLLNLVIENFEISKDEASTYIKSLIKGQILVSDCEPYVCGPDMLDYYTDYSKTQKLVTSDVFVSLQDAIKRINNTDDIDAIQSLYNSVSKILKSEKIDVPKKYLFQVDSSYINGKFSLSASIKKDLMECFHFLNYHTYSYENRNLTNFKQRFVRRYENQTIPLMEALDPNMGIGYVVERDHVTNRLLDRLQFPIIGKDLNQVTLTPLTKLLLEKLSKHDLMSHDEIQLYDGININSVISNMPLSMSAMFRLLKSNHDYIIDGLHFSGSSAANLLARFGYCDASIDCLIKEITKEEQDSVSDAILAEISYIPGMRTANILHRQQIRDYEILINANSLLDGEHIIPVSDMYVAIKNGQIVLYSHKLGRRIIPRLTTAHNYANNPSPVYRFLCDLQNQSLKASVSFSWGGIENMYAHLPRVKYKNIILSREQWIVDTNLFKKVDKCDLTLFKTWVYENKLPRFIQLVWGDNVLPIDLSSDLSVATFFSEIRNKEKILLQEFLPGAFDATDNRVYEIIIPLIKR